MSPTGRSGCSRSAGAARARRPPLDREAQGALRDPLHEHRQGAGGRRHARLALARARARRAGTALPPLRAGGGLAPTGQRLRRHSEQASIALAVDMSGSIQPKTSSRRAWEQRRRRSARFLRTCRKRLRRARDVRGRTPDIASPLTDDRNLARQALEYKHNPRARYGDRRRARALVEAAAPPSRPTAAAPPRRGRPPGSEPSALGDPAALGHRPDERRARPARRCGACEVVRHPRLHGRARHAGRRDNPPAASRARCRPIPRLPAKTTGGEFFEIHNQTRLNAVYEDLASRLGHKKEWRELSFILVGLAALFALGAGAASLVWGQRLP